MNTRTRISALLMALILFAGVIGAQRGVDSTRPRMDAAELMYLPNQKLLKHFTAGLDTIVADLLWLQCIQYIGYQIQGDRSFKWLQAMIETVVDLDPCFVDAYRYGGMFLAALKADDDAGLQLLHRGIVANPKVWVLPYEASLIYLLNRGTEPNSKIRAAHYVTMSAATGTGPEFVTKLAETLHGQYDLAAVEREMWQQRLQSEDHLLQQVAARKLLEIDLKEMCAYLNESNDRLQAQGQPRAITMEDLFRSGAVDVARMKTWEASSNFPGDPFGGKFFFDVNGKVQNTTILDNLVSQRLTTIQEAVGKYKEQYGAPPSGLDTIVSTKFMTRLPDHPYPGRRWRYDAAAGKVLP
ncbi:MAG: hypothetical protein HYV27_11285 [Candidatus Hydrogenedentes bacterium]|nr:hypothetical protein [Candidatus Hydrogenedentota bacterium]